MKQYKTLTGLLGKPERWIKGSKARDAYGNWCDPSWPDARCFCLLGAVDRLNGSHSFRVHSDLCFAIAQAIAIEFPKWRGRGIARFNDSRHRRHEDIVRVSKRADKIYRERRKQRCT